MSKKPKIFILDTNVILHDSSCIQQFQENDVVIPLTVLEELDQFKRGSQVINLNAREFSRTLDSLTGQDIFNGGVSMGDYDVVKDVLARQGEIVFWKVRTKPGKPLAFGAIKRIGKGTSSRDMPHLGLAGNAVSCMVNYELFVRPAILKMMGKKNLAKPRSDTK